MVQNTDSKYPLFNMILSRKISHVNKAVKDSGIGNVVCYPYVTSNKIFSIIAFTVFLKIFV